MTETATRAEPRFKPLPPPPPPVLPETPYKGLVPFTEADAPFFFGRDEERTIIAANLRSSPLTILYGSSGTGKSSVLRAGVVPDLRRDMVRNLESRGAPGLAVVAFSDWRDDPAAGLARAIEEALDQIVADSGGERRGLSELLVGAPGEVGGKLLVILDQFEEYFLYHQGAPDEGAFATAFVDAVNRNDIRTNFLVSLREDALAKLDAFQGEIPHLFDNYLRIEHLDADDARAAIVQPVARWNGLRPGEREVTVEPALVEAVVAELETGQVHVGQGGGGVPLDEADGGRRIETPYLQLVMTRLWSEERRSGSDVLRSATLSRLGGAERIVATHLDDVLSVLAPHERHLAALVFHYLVTPSGTKIAHAPTDLAAYVGVPEEELRPVLERLAGGDVRILRPVPRPFGETGEPRFEIFHDVLAAVILDWRTRYLKDRELSDGIRMGVAITVHVGVAILLALMTLGLIGLAFEEGANNLFGLIWSLSALTAWVFALRTLWRRWVRRERHMLLNLLKTELGVLTAPVSFIVTVPRWLLRRWRARRAARRAAAPAASR